MPGKLPGLPPRLLPSAYSISEKSLFLLLPTGWKWVRLTRILVYFPEIYYMTTTTKTQLSYKPQFCNEQVKNDLFLYLDSYMHAHDSIILNSQKMEATQTSSDSRTGKRNVIYPWTLFSNTKEQSTTTWRSLKKHYPQWKKANSIAYRTLFRLHEMSRKGT